MYKWRYHSVGIRDLIHTPCKEAQAVGKARGWFRMPSHLCADVKLFSTLCFQHQRHHTAPFLLLPLGTISV